MELQQAEVMEAPTIRELADLLSLSESSVKMAFYRGTKVGHVWRILSAAAYEERSGQQSQSPVIPTQPGDLYNQGSRRPRVVCQR